MIRQDMRELVYKEDVIASINSEPAEARYPSWYIDKIRNLPTVSRITGKWIPIYKEIGISTYVQWECSCCGYIRSYGRDGSESSKKPSASYCENCGVGISN